MTINSLDNIANDFVYNFIREKQLIDEVFDAYKAGVEPLETLVKKLNEETSSDLRKYIVHGRFMFLMLAFGFALKIF